MKLAAATSCHSVSYPLCRVNTPIGTVNFACESSSTSASANSDQYAARLKIVVAASPGATRGSAIVQSVRRRDAPSRRAASKSAGGSASKKFLITHAVNGTWIEA
jgi:hypothetical protein